MGLIATDGCLSSDGRHILITSKDLEYLKKLNNWGKIVKTISKKRGSNNDHCSNNVWYYMIQFGNKEFYNFLVSIGLTPRKSLTLGALKIPSEYFKDFLRGVIDGDGSIYRWLHPQNGGEQWSLRIYTASKDFGYWIVEEIKNILQVRGKLHLNQIKKHPLYVVKYGKMAAQQILKTCYYDNAFALERKFLLAKEYINSKTGGSISKTLITN